MKLRQRNVFPRFLFTGVFLISVAVSCSGSILSGKHLSVLALRWKCSPEGPVIAPPLGLEEDRDALALYGSA